MTWRHTEHLTIIGDTGSGKTYLENRILKLRSYVIFLRTKSEKAGDDPMDRSWKRARRVEEISTLHGHWLLEPEYERQSIEGHRLFARARAEGNWTLAIDEVLGAIDAGLERDIRWGLTQGRSQGITMVCGVQRPTTGTPIMRYVLSQSTHACVFAIEGRDANDIVAKSLSPQVSATIPKLDWQRHQFVYYHRRERSVSIETANTITRRLA